MASPATFRITDYALVVVANLANILVVGIMFRLVTYFPNLLATW